MARRKPNRHRISYAPAAGMVPFLVAALALGCDEDVTLSGDGGADGTTEDVGLDAPADVAPDRPADVPPDAADDAAEVPADADDDGDGPRTRPVLLTPSCIHTPALVGAGGPFPIAVLGRTTGCVTYDHAEITAAGEEIDLRFMGQEDLVGPCPSCLYTYVGLVWLEAPTPGPYTVRVAGWPEARTVVASGGAYEDPLCSAGCPAAALDGVEWTLARVSSDEVRNGCGDYVNVGTPVAFTGSCHDWTAAGEDWGFPSEVLHCTDTGLFFGPAAPYDVDATLCVGSSTEHFVLGIANHGSSSVPAAELFLFESD